jgi:hypothetical protein
MESYNRLDTRDEQVGIRSSTKSMVVIAGVGEGQKAKKVRTIRGHHLQVAFKSSKR